MERENPDPFIIGIASYKIDVFFTNIKQILIE
jgi:hypothetical protein